MKIRKYLRGLVLTLIALLCVAATQARTPGSKVGVSFDRTEADFGTVSADKGTVHLDFTMTNGSSDAVAILSARASCGCTEPTYTRRPLRPDESTTIGVDFHTAGQRGEIYKEVTLRLKSANGKKEKVQLVLRGVVLPE